MAELERQCQEADSEPFSEDRDSRLQEALSEIRRLRKALDGYRRPISIPFITPKSKPDVVEVGRSSYSGVCSPEEEPSKGGS